MVAIEPFCGPRPNQGNIADLVAELGSGEAERDGKNSAGLTDLKQVQAVCV